jgi:hypothetical protein
LFHHLLQPIEALESLPGQYRQNKELFDEDTQRSGLRAHNFVPYPAEIGEVAHKMHQAGTKRLFKNVS